MFALQSLIARNGAVCKEYYQPNSTGPIPGVVFASLLAKNPTECGAKTYDSEAEAEADIPNWLAMNRSTAEEKGYVFDEAYFNGTVSVVNA
jgi:hypothetical protein